MTTESARRTTGAWLFVGRVAAVVESRTLATLISNNNADKVIQVWNLSQKLLNYTHALIKQYTLFEARLQLSRQEAQLRRVTARCVLSVVILPITMQQCRNYLYDKS